MRLLIDIGNTRVKWRLINQAAVLGGALPHEDIAELVNETAKHGVPSHVWVSCVGKPEARDQVTKMAQAWGASLIIAKTCAEQHGVQCGYRQPAQMGVDRWLAVIAAYNSLRAPCIVIDAGSAITVDIVGENGCHQGGYIVPGFQKMLNSLYHETSQVKVSALIKPDTAPGLSTQEAVSNGLYTMVSGVIDRATTWLAESASAPQFIITGGDAPLLEELGIKCIRYENLVLDGLALIAEQNKAEQC